MATQAMKTRRFQQVDVFSARRCRGNALAVVVDGDGLCDAAMARFSHWTVRCAVIVLNACMNMSVQSHNPISTMAHFSPPHT
jgi:hypothetical protein